MCTVPLVSVCIFNNRGELAHESMSMLLKFVFPPKTAHCADKKGF
jgi:hypothetical protein